MVILMSSVHRHQDCTICHPDLRKRDRKGKHLMRPSDRRRMQGPDEPEWLTSEQLTELARDAALYEGCWTSGCARRLA